MELKYYVTEYVFSIKPRRSLFLVKPQGFPINGNERACEGVSGLIEVFKRFLR